MPARESSTPAGHLYRRIEHELRDRLAGNGFEAGARLPSEAQLSREFNTTRVTIAKALKQLERDGLIRRVAGLGTFVAQKPALTSFVDTSVCHSFEDRIRFGGQNVTYRLLAFTRVPSPAFARAHLGEGDSDSVYQLERLRLVADTIVGIELRYIPIDLASRITGPMLAERSTAEIISELLGRRVPTISVTMYPQIADAVLAKKLGIRPRSAVTVKEHVYRDRDGTVLLCGKSIYTSEVRTTYVTGAGNSSADSEVSAL